MERNTSYTPSKSWCRGCGEYRYDNFCTNTPAVNYAKRLGGKKNEIPCWLVRGTVYCKRDNHGIERQM